MHLHIVFVLSYSVCLSVKILSCVDVIQSFTYLLHIFYMVLCWTSLKDVAREHKRKRHQRPLTNTIKKEKNKTGTSGCGSFVVVAAFQSAASIDHCLHMSSYVMYNRESCSLLSAVFHLAMGVPVFILLMKIVLKHRTHFILLHIVILLLAVICC